MFCYPYGLLDPRPGVHLTAEPGGGGDAEHGVVGEAAEAEVEAVAGKVAGSAAGVGETVAAAVADAAVAGGECVG